MLRDEPIAPQLDENTLEQRTADDVATYKRLFLDHMQTNIDAPFGMLSIRSSPYVKYLMGHYCESHRYRWPSNRDDNSVDKVPVRL